MRMGHGRIKSDCKTSLQAGIAELASRGFCKQRIFSEITTDAAAADTTRRIKKNTRHQSFLRYRVGWTESLDYEKVR